MGYICLLLVFNVIQILLNLSVHFPRYFGRTFSLPQEPKQMSVLKLRPLYSFLRTALLQVVFYANANWGREICFPDNPVM